jgi:hypothetical protein
LAIGVLFRAFGARNDVSSQFGPSTGDNGVLYASNLNLAVPNFGKTSRVCQLYFQSIIWAGAPESRFGSERTHPVTVIIK